MKNKGKVYISAPISGYDINERREYFRNMAQRLLIYGYTPVNPFDNGVPVGADVKSHMKADFKMLLDSDYILLCDGWNDSLGCQHESSLSLWAGIPQLPNKSIGLK